MDFGLLASRTAREHISVVSRYQLWSLVRAALGNEYGFWMERTEVRTHLTSFAVVGRPRHSSEL